MMLPSKEGFGMMPSSLGKSGRDTRYIASYYFGEGHVCACEMCVHICANALVAVMREGMEGREVISLWRCRIKLWLGKTDY